ncbi:hypothetical protein GRJ2_001286500 [Grus japonensis]|uniref:Uncharacterized protein n=1 Tax=Grus japonensis TaxID=30415 RepID=A0ABC9WUJ8_GRUJA
MTGLVNHFLMSEISGYEGRLLSQTNKRQLPLIIFSCESKKSIRREKKMTTCGFSSSYEVLERSNSTAGKLK